MRTLYLVLILSLPAYGVRAEEAVLYLSETDPRPLEIDGGPAAMLPQLRFDVGPRDPAGALSLVAREANSVAGSIPELSGAEVATDPAPIVRSSSTRAVSGARHLPGNGTVGRCIRSRA